MVNSKLGQIMDERASVMQDRYQAAEAASRATRNAIVSLRQAQDELAAAEKAARKSGAYSIAAALAAVRSGVASAVMISAQQTEPLRREEDCAEIAARDAADAAGW